MTGPTIRRAILLAVVFGVPVLFLQGVTNDPFNVPKLGLLVAGASLVAAIRFAEILLGARPAALRRLAIPIASVTLPLLIAWLASPYREWALWGEYSRFQGLIPYLVVVLFGALVADAFAGRPLPIAWAISAAGAVIGGYTLLQSVGVDPIEWQSAELMNASTIGHTNFSGGFLGIALPVSIWLWIKGDRGRKWAAIFTILAAEGWLLANSQGGWIAGIAGISIVAGNLLQPRWRRARAAGLVVAATVGLGVVVYVSLSLLVPDSRFIAPTAASRGVLWATAVEMAAESPLVGRGPNAYALEGVRYRPVSDALVSGYGKSDDPHSVPLSFLANAGILGAIGYLLALGWAIRAGLRASRQSSLAAAFCASLVAYAVQALVSIDTVPLRTVFWAALAGLVCIRSADVRSPDWGIYRSSSLHKLAPAVALVLLGSAFAATTNWTARWFVADERVQRGVDLFANDRPYLAQVEFDAALASRDDPHYRQIYGELLGLAGLERGRDGALLIDRMVEVNGYLSRLPDTHGLMKYARVLHYWGTFDPGADRRALDLLHRAVRLDPHNPLVRVLMSEVLLDLGRQRDALAVLRPLAPELSNASPEFWGALSIARLEAGNIPGASTALEQGEAVDPGNCRVRIAEELLRVSRGGRPAPQGTAALNIGLACDAGVYQIFLDLLGASRAA